MDSMEKIFNQHGMMVYKYLISLTRDQDLAEELTQETFYQATKNLKTYDGKAKVTTWLIAIAKNVYYGYLRKNKQTYDIDESIHDNLKVASTEEVVLEKISNLELMKALQKMKQPNKDVLYLRLFGNLSFKEIGEILDQTENWARVTFYRSKNLIRKELENEK